MGFTSMAQSIPFDASWMVSKTQTGISVQRGCVNTRQERTGVSLK